MNRRTFLSSAVPATVLAPSFGKAAKTTPHIGPIHLPDDALLTKLPTLMDVAWLPGIGIGAVRPGKPVWMHYAGVGTTETNKAIDATSLFPGASCGKPLFACAVLKMAQEGTINLDRPLNHYLQDDALEGQWGDKVTARHVLSHSSGLPNWRGERTDKLTPMFEPGTGFRYSGEGFFHLQRVVEHITGVSFEAMMQEKIFKPLGMNSSTYLWLADADARYVMGHNGQNEFANREMPKQVFDLIHGSDKPMAYWTYERIVEGWRAKTGKPLPPMPSDFSPNVAFSLLATVPDYMCFLAALVDPESEALGLSAAMRTMMQTPVSKVNNALAWGLGMGIEETQGQSYLWQWGDNGGWKNFILVHTPTQTALAVFSNGSNGQRVNERTIHAATGIDHPVFLWV